MLERKSVLLSLLIVCFLMLSASCFAAEVPVANATMANAKGGLKYTVTVSKFDNQSGWKGQWDLGGAWGTVLTDTLNKTGQFIVLGETGMRNAAMQEQDLAASGRTVQGSSIAPPTGQMTPAQILVKGAITHVQETGSSGGAFAIGPIAIGGSEGRAEINVTMYMVDSTTGMVLASTSVVGNSESSSMGVGIVGGGWGAAYGNEQKSNMGKAVQDAIGKGVNWMIAQLPNIQWRGSVVMIKDGKVYINRGAREGVRVGQIFKVGVSEVLRDPSTGEVLDISMQDMATLKVSDVKEKMSLCDVDYGDINAIKQGMTVVK